MAINRESNAYTVIFAIIMVVVVGGILAFLFMTLNPTIKANQQNEKKQNILQAIGINETGGDDFTRKKAAEVFDQYVVKRITLDFEGNIVKELTNKDSINPKDLNDAFNVDLRKEYKMYGKKLIKGAKGDDAALVAALKKEDRIRYPLFVCEKGDSTFYVMPAVGTGLWDDVWGYIGMLGDCETINGAIFDHAAETPGLGSKVTEDWFQVQFEGKKMVDAAGEFQPIVVKKPGGDLKPYEVDGISGATFTGNGVGEMLERSFGVYMNFFKAHPEYKKL